MCDKDCFNCPYEDCINDDNSTDELSDEIEKYAKKDRPYNSKESNLKYLNSQKGKETRKKYAESEKGKEIARKSSKKYYQKNSEAINNRRSEYFKEYHAKNKEHRKEVMRAYYKSHKEEIRAKQKEKRELTKSRYRKVVVEFLIPIDAVPIQATLDYKHNYRYGNEEYFFAEEINERKVQDISRQQEV